MPHSRSSLRMRNQVPLKIKLYFYEDTCFLGCDAVSGHVVSSVSNNYNAFIFGVKRSQDLTCPETLSHIRSPPSLTTPLWGTQNLALYFYVSSILLMTLQHLITLILVQKFNVMSVCLRAYADV